MATAKHKRYAYVDESGQDTKGELFLVAVVVTESERDALRRRLGEIERESGKCERKWTKTPRDERSRYPERIISLPDLARHLYFSSYRGAQTYVDLTILSTAKALNAAAHGVFEATIFVDGLGRKERHRFAAGLRKLRITVRKVRGVRDESDEFTRLADAIAGFVRDALGGDETMRGLLELLQIQFGRVAARAIVRRTPGAPPIVAPGPRLRENCHRHFGQTGWPGMIPCPHFGH
ncbi:MAG: hypothetical protein FJ398_18390 [Verrucomicrobia bacterium]|nr:hypothetical protein [Verrucomicrobiota bacterium]